MPSTLAWLDHDAAQQDRMQRILTLFDEKGTADQLGLGGIRDAFSDRLFPGTSTVQTRLRYFLFVPWIYKELEARQVSANRMAAKARERELRLIEPLRASGADGVLGARAGQSLKILPSAIYWSGLKSWGIRRFEPSRGEYHSRVDDLYAKRKMSDEPLSTWHPALPDPPESFPEAADMRLRREEAEFLQDRIIASHPKSLLALLARGGDRTAVDFPWEHPRYESFKEEHKETLHHARLFSEMKHGAAVLYNLEVARKAGDEELIEEHSAGLTEWVAQLDMAEVEAWDLNELWMRTLNQGHTIDVRTRRFADRWLKLVQSGGDLAGNTEAKQLVRTREMSLKGGHSKFRNQRALEEKWGGHSGTGRMDYRWSVVQTELNDLYTGLEAD